jgi:hypothetical protein
MKEGLGSAMTRSSGGTMMKDRVGPKARNTEEP